MATNVVAGRLQHGMRMLSPDMQQAVTTKLFNHSGPCEPICVKCLLPQPYKDYNDQRKPDSNLKGVSVAETHIYQTSIYDSDTCDEDDNGCMHSVNSISSEYIRRCDEEEG